MVLRFGHPLPPTFIKLLLYMQYRIKCWKHGRHGTAAMFGKLKKHLHLCIHYPFSSIWFDEYVVIPTKVKVHLNPKNVFRLINSMYV